jgi:hypothetical protein
MRVADCATATRRRRLAASDRDDDGEDRRAVEKRDGEVASDRRQRLAFTFYR